MPPERTSVVVVGGGPCGLMLANELGRRGVAAIVLDRKPGTAFNPQANATQARTMEHFRRHGFADEVRALGMPADYPTDIAYFTRFATHELARFQLPSANEARQRVGTLSGSWSAAELPHRVSQKFVEQVLRRHAESLPSISVRYGWAMTRFRERAQGVEVDVERTDGCEARTIAAAYLVGADGARSAIRQALGIGWTGETGTVRDFLGGRMYAIYLRAPGFYEATGHAPAWMNVTFNRERRAFMCAVDGRGEFAFHTQLRAGEDEASIDGPAALAMFEAAVGKRIDAEVLARDAWTAGHALVAERFGRGRIFLGGDAAHLFTPTGGLGYNTAIDDAVNLGWKLATVLRGAATPALLDSYQAERRPAAIRNTGYARQFADSIGRFAPVPGIEDDTPEGAAARRAAGEYLQRHARAEFDIPGVTFGVRYDGSPVIVSDGTSAPADEPNRYRPCATPGGRLPHLWLAPGVSLYDRLGFEWSLLRMGSSVADAMPIAERAARAGIEPTQLELPGEEARELYGADLVLVRPDQVVAWRGSAARARERAATIIGMVLADNG